MIKIIIFLLMAPIVSFASSFDSDIEKLENNLSKATTTNHIIMYMSDLVELYNNELIKSTKDIKDKALKASQKIWGEYKKAEFKYMEKKYSKKNYGTSSSIFITKGKIIILKSRYEYLKMILENK